jgi:hypothetical protein
MGWQHVQGDCIAVRQEKTNNPLLIPINAPLAAALAALPRTNMIFGHGSRKAVHIRKLRGFLPGLLPGSWAAEALRRTRSSQGGGNSTGQCGVHR